MFKHFCDMCGAELIKEARTLEIKNKEIAFYNTTIMSNYSNGFSSCVCATPYKIGNLYEICVNCANEIENKIHHREN